MRFDLLIKYRYVIINVERNTKPKGERKMSKKGNRQRIVAVAGEKVRGISNPELSRAMQAKNSSSAASPFEDQTNKRARSREAAKARAIKDFDHS